jgi:Calpain family cysteine protease/Bacterial pre-peptidase C-terminal domain
MPLDSAGNTMGSARSLALTATSQTWGDWVGATDTQDFYRFTLSGRSQLAASVSGLTNNADLQLIRDVNSNGIIDSGDVLSTSGNAGTTNEVLNTYLNAGTYFLRVYQRSGDTNYTLGATATLLPNDLAGNTLPTARSIALTNTPQTWNDFVNGGDTQDFYRFSIGARSAVKLDVARLTNNADLQLIRDTNNNGVIDSGETIATSGQASITNESILSYLDAGTYFARIYQRTGDTAYSLQASSTVLPIDNAGNTVLSARNITLSTTSTTFQDWVGNDDTKDYYKFTLSAQSDVNIHLHGMTANANVQLLNANNVVLKSSTQTGTTADTIVGSYAAGTYYIYVYRNGTEQTNYNLTAFATPVDTDNQLTTARNVTIGSTTTRIVDSLASFDLTDLYKVNLSTANNNNAYSVNFTLTGLTGNANLDLLDSSGLSISQSNLSGTSNETISRLLMGGTYYLKVWNGGTSSLNYTINLTANIAPPTTDWFTVNLTDAGLMNAARTASFDGNLSRADMIGIFRATQIDGLVSAAELKDLRTIVTNASRWSMTDDVKTLSAKLLSTDRANLTYQGKALAVLGANSTAGLMENLVNKWFFGLDRPTLTSTNYSYRSISGSLFQSGISATDIKQGQIGDCYFLASLASIAQEQPSYIQNMFIDNGDNTWTVRFRNGANWDYVTVDRFLATNSSGTLVYASSGSNFANASNELWVALAEKAYAQIGESGWTRGLSNATNSYAAIEGGWMTYVITQVTGLKTDWDYITTITQQTLINWVNSNKILTLGTNSAPGNGLVEGHAYAITGYDASTQKFFVRNPWGSKHVELTYAQLVTSGVDLAYSI